MTFKKTIYTTTSKRIIDALLGGVAFWIAYQLRFEAQIPPSYEFQLWLLLPGIMLGRVLANSLLGVYRRVWHYFQLPDVLSLGRIYVALSLTLLALRFGSPDSLSVLRVPLSVITLEYLLSVVGALTARALRRAHYRRNSRRAGDGLVRRVVLVGAGSAGAMVAQELMGYHDVKLVGFLDDDLEKEGQVINGVLVLGPTSALPAIVRCCAVDEVIVCITRAPRAAMKRLWLLCEQLAVRIRIIPTFEEILSGKVSVASFRDVQMTDLLARDAIDLSVEAPAVCRFFHGKRILITGAGGSIGGELARQLLQYDPEQLVLLDKDENGLYEIYLQLSQNGNRPTVVPVVADVRVPERLRAVFSRYRPEVIFHAAAHKHVPLMEINPCEAVLNNIIGTRNVVEQSVASGVSSFVLISTDKAVKPSSVMGASKRVCEMIVQAQDSRTPTQFSCVRFGNVLGSRGSVVPIFQKQIAAGGPVTITHPEVMRFLMTIPEAVHLVIQTATLQSSGKLFMLDMGNPVPITALARDLIELSGLQPGKDIRIETTGLRPGEKLAEELFDSATETVSRTSLDKIWEINGQPVDEDALQGMLDALEDAARRDVREDIYRLFQELDFGFVPGPEPVPVPSVAIEASQRSTAELHLRPARNLF